MGVCAALFDVETVCPQPNQTHTSSPADKKLALPSSHHAAVLHSWLLGQRYAPSLLYATLGSVDGFSTYAFAHRAQSNPFEPVGHAGLSVAAAWLSPGGSGQLPPQLSPT